MEGLSSFNNASIKEKIIFFVAIILAVFIAILFGNKNAEVIINEDTIEIEGANGASIKYKDIIKIDTIANLPPIVMRTNGSSTWNRNKGNFILKDIGSVRLFMKTTVTPIVVLQLKNKEIYYINCENKQLTIRLFENINQKVNK